MWQTNEINGCVGIVATSTFNLKLARNTGIFMNDTSRANEIFHKYEAVKTKDKYIYKWFTLVFRSRMVAYPKALPLGDLHGSEIGKTSYFNKKKVLISKNMH